MDLTAYRRLYKVMRSIIFAVVGVVVGLYALLYVGISFPYVQNRIKDVAVNELSNLLGTKVQIDEIGITPFSQVTLSGVAIPSPDGGQCITIRRLGAGINLFKLIFEGKIIITYGEIIGLDVKVVQPAEDAPLNIQFLIDALKPKDKNKPPTKFDLQLKNIVIRQSSASFDKLWKPRLPESRFDVNHLKISNLKADVALPVLKNDNFRIDLRRLTFQEKSGLDVTSLSCDALITPWHIDFKDFKLLLPGSHISFSDITLDFNGFDNIVKALKQESFSIRFDNNHITPADLTCFLPTLDAFKDPIFFTADFSGCANDLKINEFKLSGADLLHLDLVSDVRNLLNPKDLEVNLVKLDGWSDLSRILGKLGYLNTPNLAKYISPLGNISLDINGFYSPAKVMLKGDVNSGIGSLDLNVIANCVNDVYAFNAKLKSSGLELSEIADPKLGHVIFDVSGDGKISKSFKNLISCDVDANIPLFEFEGRQYTDIEIAASKATDAFFGSIYVDNDNLSLSATGSYRPKGADSGIDADISIGRFVPSTFGLLPKYPGYNLRGHLYASLKGEKPADMEGEVSIMDLSFKNASSDGLKLDKLTLASKTDETGYRTIDLASDFISGWVKGNFNPSTLPASLTNMFGSVMPQWMPMGWTPKQTANNSLDFSFTVAKDNNLTEFFKLPVRLLVDIPIKGTINEDLGIAELNVDIPFLQQGKDKLIHDTSLSASIDTKADICSLLLKSVLPGKVCDVNIGLDAMGRNNEIYTGIMWEFQRDKAFRGDISLTASTQSSPIDKKRSYMLKVNPSEFQVNDSVWHVERGEVEYADKQLDVRNLHIWHDRQSVIIDGRASDSPNDKLHVALRKMDLDYIFETLAINNVTFGGMASGDVYASSVFSSSPEAYTDKLQVKDLTYNGCLMGDDALIKSRWHNDEKKVSIYADINEKGKRCATVDGALWVTRDSLSFAFDADKVNVKFLKPFMAAFSSDIEGRATGQATLYGTFHDVDIKGKVFADTIRMKVDYTNVYYGGSDTVYMYPGRIYIPSFRVYDKRGHSAVFSGNVTHNYFHDAYFDFSIKDAKGLLCYDTGPAFNPDWYGTIYGTGGGSIKGGPGYVNILVDMTTDPGSTFTFVLNDTQAATAYDFLTFTDKRKASRADATQVEEVSMLEFFREKLKKQHADEEENKPTIVDMDLRATVTPGAKITLVIDPASGDKITASGDGALQLGYNSETDDLSMFGKYTLREGQYNFSLQDLILKDFTIRQGSSISFNGDPYNATLNIDALYRVNTNLTDLDKSFASDRDLNRTNVPVDAVLKVGGNLQNPEISFDIELPTLTEDVTRKVKSIISTEDMMSRQIIYLLALSRFYTPEYMGTTSSGGELTAVASTTLSSQLSNALGQISDKWSVAPSFRSDKGDFSDLEFDLMLSSRLLNNRLLLNGNFGYRDRSTSTTTFVGDFDIEYLLNRSGNIRLKAYNHFNDQNYYLRSALTTQGIGVLFRHDFDNPFAIFRRRKTEKPASEAAPADSIR